MGIARVSLYILGAALIVGGLVLLYFETGLVEWVPMAVAGAALLVLLGLLVLGMTSRVTEPVPVRRVETHHHERHRRDREKEEVRPETATVRRYERSESTMQPVTDDRTVDRREARARRVNQAAPTRRVQEQYVERDFK